MIDGATLEILFQFIIQFMLMLIIIFGLLLHDRYKRTDNYIKQERLWHTTRRERRNHVAKLKLERLKQGKKL